MPYGQRIYYVIGPMRGKPYYNADAFDAAEARLRAQGHDVISPIKMDLAVGVDVRAYPPDTDWRQYPPGFDRDACFRRCMDAVGCATHIYRLTGWAASTGACAESYGAMMRGIPIEDEEG